MCGICGLVNLDRAPADPGAVGRMNDALAHRGPDGQGVFVNGPAGFGHRRLAIIDLSERADQPMTDPLAGLTLVYNGELYNFRELRRELEDEGVSFASDGDTEVVLKAFGRWGPTCFDRFNGMFALAVWDHNRSRLTLARDRYGVKPLYWTIRKNTLLFASEIKAFPASGLCRAEVDVPALVEYFTFQNIFSDRSLFAGVQTFPPGCWAVAVAGGTRREPVFTRYWAFDFQEHHAEADEAGLAEECDRLFKQAVKRQLVSDVEVGAYLSGGIDSSSVCCLAAESLDHLKTFTCGFDLHSASGMELNFDERDRAEHLSYLLGTEHYEVVLKSGDMERLLPMVAWHLDEPRVGQSYPNLAVSKLASRFVKVVLTGTGGDEIFGGYPWRYFRGDDFTGFDSYSRAYYGFWQRLVPDDRLGDLFTPVKNEAGQINSYDVFRSIFPSPPPRVSRLEEALHCSMTFEAKTFLHGLLMVEDKLSMAYGLEARVPFLDNDLVDFAQGLPARFKVLSNVKADRVNENTPGPKTEIFHRRTSDGKLLLRKVLSHYVPPVISQAAKQGFSAPDASWFKGDSINYVRALIIGSKARIYDYLDRSLVRSLVMDHLEGRANRRLFIWSLLNFEWWLRLFVK
ncbi:MAG: asparagine synthase (glutamine-hydrolyzing) [Thermodesulfobacteriota bacterium]